MVKPRRTGRCFLPAARTRVTQVRFPVSPGQQRAPPPQQGSDPGSADAQPHLRPPTTEGERTPAGPGLDGGSGEVESKRSRVDGSEAGAALTNRETDAGSCGPAGDIPPPYQQGAAEHKEDSRAAELQGVGSLKVTIQQSSGSREFGQTAGLHCHICDLTCRTLQVFQEHMSGAEHLRKLQDITHSIRLSTHTLLQRGPCTQRWCDTCQTHFSGDVIVHRQTKEHKMCKQLCRPFCPVCKRYFRTPRKFVEHMKSPEHKEQVQQQEAQEDELITVDAVGCFEEEEAEAEVADEEEDAGKEEAVDRTCKSADPEEDCAEYNPRLTCGSSFVVPVRGFVCQLCKKFFYRETAARHTHCRTHAHYLNLQNHRAQRGRGERDEGQS
ncbi:cdkn1a interacting zinc finger protein 1b isoform X2 [Parambassis ranga]|uniref:Cdkn1a interacting zinc finger protein 1b isoform X2 n=1 Tax=Parambassis ranga TaxID=210632 RepID=A0A6P7J298_9TELE|nr:cip1-interacting zinc finger protein-like isoform X2 [Parambassis ranga]